ncbi:MULTISPECIES: SH3 domain-containing protein [unclassified Ensifer]|uniref:SH3 domain-containing protein n=1 Tax=unclassified Ensifer TaxID=2633371 RepID=UPI000B21E30B|nr:MULTISPECIES: SH3 domain-containing protein [unclassified Ensifer]
MNRSIGRWGILATVHVALLLGHVAQAHGAKVECTVADPTGTPLNVRDAPNGRVVMTLSNGARVHRTAERELNGKRWSLVANEAGTLGWVFSAYLGCVSTDRDQQKSAPMRPRPTSN